MGKILYQYLGEASYPVATQKIVIQLLGKIRHHEAVPRLNTILTSRPKLYRETAIALARIGSEMAQESLLSQLQLQMASDDNLDAKMAIIHACGYFEPTQIGKDLLPILITALQSPPKKLRQAALDSLICCTGKNFGYNATGWRSWWEHLGNRREERRQQLLTRLKDQTTATRIAALQQLTAEHNRDLWNKDMRAGVETILLDGLANESDHQVLPAIIAQAGCLRIDKAIPPLKDLLWANPLQWRIAAAKALANFPRPDVVAALHSLLDEAKLPQALALAIIEAIGRCQDAKSIDVLYEQLADRPQAIRAATVKALAVYGDNRKNISLFIDLLADENRLVRGAAHSAFGLGNPPILPARPRSLAGMVQRFLFRQWQVNLFIPNGSRSHKNKKVMECLKEAANYWKEQINYEMSIDKIRNLTVPSL